MARRRPIEVAARKPVSAEFPDHLRHWDLYRLHIGSTDHINAFREWQVVRLQWLKAHGYLYADRFGVDWHSFRLDHPPRTPSKGQST